MSKRKKSYILSNFGKRGKVDNQFISKTCDVLIINLIQKEERARGKILDQKGHKPKQEQGSRLGHKEDTSQGRINKLKQVIRAALFEDKKSICNTYLVSKLKDISSKEVEVVLSIVSFLKPYLPSRADYSTFSHQFIFVLMASQVLRSLGRHGQVTKIVPIFKPSKLYSLCIDVNTIYSLFCGQSVAKKMMLYDYDNNIISSASVTSTKDAVFSSFFFRY